MISENSNYTDNDHRYSPLTWLGSDRVLAWKIGRPIMRFVRIEAAGGFVLIAATVAAVMWANSPWSASYHEFLETHVSVSMGGIYTIDEPLEAWINDALMAIFFFVVGLEIKREMVVGELRKPAAAALPAVAALGGMVVPALIYTAFNVGGSASSGWGIPMATDIAFALGVLSLLGNRVPSSLKIFLLSLAIVDDVGAIVVIAVFYTDGLSSGWLLVAACLVFLLLAMRVTRIWYAPAYLVVGLALWLAIFESGVHATFAGVILGVFTPARPLVSSDVEVVNPIAKVTTGPISVPIIRRTSFELREHVSVVDRLEDLLHPWTSFFIIPVFALANAGVSLSTDAISEALDSPVTLGIVAGLVLGKLSGIWVSAWLGVRSGLCQLPQDATWAKIAGVSAVAGIGFTVSLFIAGLEFKAGPHITDAKIGIFTASVIAAVVGVVILRFSKPSDLSPDAEQVRSGPDNMDSGEQVRQTSALIGSTDAPGAGG